MFVAALFWGTSATLARFMFHDRNIPALTAVELRLVIAVALLAPWMALRRREALRLRREDLGYLLCLGVFGVASIQGSYYYTISVFGVGLAILLQYLAPSLIVAFDALRGAAVGRLTVVAVVAALAGTGLLVGNVDPGTLHATPWQWAIGFGSAVVFAFYILFSKRALARYAPDTVLLYTFAVAAVVWAFVTPPWVIAAAHYTATDWMMFAALGLTSTLLPFVFFYSGLRHLSPAEAGIVATMEPVVAVLSAGVFLGEGLRSLQWLGAGLVLTAALLASVQTAGKRRR